MFGPERKFPTNEKSLVKPKSLSIQFRLNLNAEDREHGIQ